MARTRGRMALTVVAALLLTPAFATQASAATFTVDTTADTSDADTSAPACADAAGKCSLRAAVDQANAMEGGDAIDLPEGRYVLSDAGSLEIGEANIAIAGAGARNTIVDADGWDRAFYVDSDTGLVASGLTVTGGLPCGCGAGGAFFVEPGATLDLSDARLTRNQVAEGPGGAIFSVGDVSLTRVRLDHNTAYDAGGGILALGGGLQIVDSSLQANSTQGDGGAIAYLAFDPCLDCAPPDELEAAPGDGTVAISGTTLSDNKAGARGGAIYTDRVGVEEGPVELLTAALEGDGQPLQIENSTISGNASGISQGGDDGDEFRGGAGGGIYNAGGEMALVNDTVAENHNVLSTTGDISAGGNITTTDAVRLRNTIVAAGTDWGERNNCVSFAQENLFVSEGNNLEDVGDDDHLDDCNLDQPSDKPNTEPRLGDLADNGGPTSTHALLDGSPAIDAGSNDAGPALDQRGGDRPPAGGSAGATRDIGAYEAYSLADLSIEAKAGAPNPVVAGSPLTYTIVVRNNGPDKVNGATLTDTLPGGAALVSADGCAGGVTCALDTLDAGAVRTVTIVVKPTAAGTLDNTASIAAPGITDPVASNDSGSTSTQVISAPVAPKPHAPDQEPEPDRKVEVNLAGPGTATLDQFMDGIVVEADCKDEACLRRFREHAAINTGASHIAGYNLTVSRASLPASSKRTRIRLRPCQSGSKNGRRHKRCMKNLRKAARKAHKFKVKVVVSVVDAAGNKGYAKTFVTVKP
jgi:uncharacterized repeat protein (TIGR01451 family)/CSLREA domain-containing protein